jgi:hypothetical protein
MALLLTFDGLKAALLTTQRTFGVCDGYINAMRAKDYQELIDAGIPVLVTAYKSGVVTDALLAEVDEALLNQNGIYTTNATITDPIFEIFVFGTAEVTLNVTNGEQHNINVLGTAIAHVNVSGNTWIGVKDLSKWNGRCYG